MESFFKLPNPNEHIDEEIKDVCLYNICSEETIDMGDCFHTEEE
tara:strand:+ start:534 stop:665 length:132 start_codon:yes stop_codon:yes gene_type:complete